MDPQQNYLYILPEIIVSVAGFLVMLVDAFTGGKNRKALAVLMELAPGAIAAARPGLRRPHRRG